MKYSHRNRWEKFVLTILVLFMTNCFLKAQSYYPQVLCYTSGQSVTTADSMTISFHGGSVRDSLYRVTFGSGRTLQGMPYGLVYAPNAFEKDIFVSKGYYPNYVQLNWEIARFQNAVTAYKIYRKLLQDDDSMYVQVANLSNSATSWQDEFAEAGTMYEYKLLADGLFAFQQDFLNTLQGVGFRLPSGKVNGRVTYAGGGAVQGVSLIAETSDNFSGSSVQLNGTTSYMSVSPPLNHAHFQFTDRFTYQAWVNPTNSGSTIMQKGTQYKISHTTGSVTFTAGATNLTVNFTQKVDTFFNITAVRTPSDSLKLFILYNENEYYDSTIALPGATAANNDEVYIGKDGQAGTAFYQGYMDEIRIWHKALTNNEILKQTFLIIAGTEDSLSGYYRLNEGVGSNFFDLSRKGFSFNEKHGFMSDVTWSTKVPIRSQLSVKAITDANGNYLITGIPYTSDGSTYRIVPAFGVHSFDPTERLMFIGPGSNVYSDVNFTDVASFAVTGEVFYKDTKFPVQGVEVKIDGIVALNSEGVPISTNVNGRFTVDVPIGEHRLQLYKYGHSFAGGGYFPTDSTKYDFQQSLTIQTKFRDNTLIKVIGKVVGGPVQEAKPNGMNRTVNNIGRSKIVLTTQREWDLKELVPDQSGNWQNSYYEDDSLVTYGQTDWIVKNTSPKEIEITPDPETGEYYAYLLPESYVVKKIVAGNPNSVTPNYTFDASYHTTVSLSSAFLNTTETDSVELTVGDPNTDYRIDSTVFNREQNFILRVQPSVKMTSPDTSVARFWEKEIESKDGTTQTVSTDNYNGWSGFTSYPMFKQRGQYQTKVTVFEQYNNVDVPANPSTDNVPVIDGKVQIQNAIAINTKKQTFDLDENGQVEYSFRGGLPNTAPNGANSFLNSMAVKVFTGKGGAIVSDWPSGGGGFKGYLIGGMPSGNNFVTAGPNVVSMIIRDPHGTGSYAFYEEGTSNSTEISYAVSNGEQTSASLTASFGAKVITYQGTPVAGVITEAETTADATIGVEQSTEWVDNSTSVVTTKNTKKWSTSDSPDFVGAIGDVFIGNSTNIVYGRNVYLDLIPDADCADANAFCINASGIPGYQIGLYNGIRLSPEFSTGFQYTQNHIENYLIPNLEFLRNEFLKAKVNSTEYDLNPTGLPLGFGDPNFGMNNDSASTVRRTDSTGIDGNLYSINYPGGSAFPDTVEYIDSVAWYNSQIKGWEDLLARNEREKLDAELIANYSFDAGTVFESSTEVENSNSNQETFEFTISPKVAGVLGAEFSGVGLKMEMSATYNHKETKSTTTNQTTAQTFGFVLADGDEGDYYSIDVKDAKSQTGPVFSVRGGQSMCPYVGEEKTKYYNPGEIFSESTMRREVPKISVDQAIVTNVPQGKSANFLLHLSNVSETEDEAWYRLTIDEASVAGGLLKIDGAPLGNGRTFYIPERSTLNKILSIEQAVADSFKFEDVKLVLHSLCQYDPGDNWEDISDTVSVSAYFQPACSEVTITNPDDKWLINTSDMVFNGTVIQSIPMNIGLGSYNLNHSTFEKVAVQYKSSSSSQWISDMVYFVDTAAYNAASPPKQLINGNASLNYTFEMKSLQDRNYDVRLRTFCADGTTNSSDIVAGTKDVKRPKLFGTPQPGDGILSPGDDIMVTLDEDVQAGLLTSFNFSVRGVLNGADIAHNSVLFFDGVNDNASVIEGVNLENKSFTIEFWTRRLTDNQGVIFSQGDLELGFNASNNFYAKFGTQTLTTATSYTTADNWMHWAVSYDYEQKTTSFYMNSTIALDNGVVSSSFKPTSRIYIGQAMNQTNFYHGYMHDFRIWESAKGQGSVVANMNVMQRGDEVGLSGFWPMDEASGSIATDKSRNHHALLNGASWAVFPVGYARTFNGSGDYITIPSGTVIATNEMDMTIEFWMKAGPQTNTVIFSNGRGDNSDPSPPTENIWVIGSDAGGKLYALNNGKTLNVSADVFDNEWHHIALVVKRIANTSLYIDGNISDFDLSSNFGGFSGAQMCLGARQFRTGPTYSYDQYFNGRVDEFRFWKLARTKKLIDLDKNSKLSGDEVGLMAYFPFDEYDVNLVLQPSMEFKTSEDTIIATANGGTASNADVPNIKDARPVQNVGFNWVVNEDQIIINVTEDPAVIEKTVLEITVQDVEDLNENRLASPITWTAFINKNTVLWNESVKNFEKELYKELTFEVDILNKGGTEQNYEITNMPNWLVIDYPTGVLAPNSAKTIHFTILGSTNIGEYEQSLYLSSDFGFKEKLELNLIVRAESPNWTVNPGDYEYNMSIIGTLNINGIVSTNPEDKIAAVVNGEIRGVASLQYISQYDMYQFYLDVYSNESYGDSIEFKVWNASEGKIQVDVTPELAFINNSVVGLPSNPQEFIVLDNVIVAYPLKKGWNWLSFNVNSAKLNTSNNLFTDLTPTDGDIIKTVGKYDQYGSGTSWIGEISKQGGFDLASGYKMKVASKDTFYVIGSSVLTENVSIPLVTGWNWVGYPSELNMQVNTALSNLNFADGDFIKGQNGFAVYDQFLGWIGSLDYLVPTRGYMLKVSAIDTLTYPNASVSSQKTKSQEAPTAPWDLTYSEYSKNMSVVAKLNLCNKMVDPSQDYVGIFFGDECRGYVRPTYVSELNQYEFFVSAYANVNGEQLSFKYFHQASGTTLDISETISFVSDEIVGSLRSPLDLSVETTNTCWSGTGSGLNPLSAHPNPFNAHVQISYATNNDQSLTVTISSIAGQVIRELELENGLVDWDGKDSNGRPVSLGVYIITVQNSGTVHQAKLIKIENN